MMAKFSNKERLFKLRELGLIISPQDEDLINRSSWFLDNPRSPRFRNHYGFLHRAIFSRIIGRKLRKNETIDHSNGNPLDNRRENLRACTRSQNCVNKKTLSSNTSGYTGVYFFNGKWCAELTHNKKRIHLGRYENKYAAAAIRAACAITLHGEFYSYEKI